MSRMIRLPSEYLAEILQDFKQSLQESRHTDGTISYNKKLKNVNRKATLYFSEIAWLKMQALIAKYKKEVAWHGVAVRGEDDSKDEYWITDILVYPQEVTGVTVNTKQEEYEMWLMNQGDDVFRNIRAQGHSHVDMGVAPSGVDLEHQRKVLNQLEDDMFYIFMIWNKKGDRSIWIYDLAKNILFCDSDVLVEVLDDGLGITSFLSDADKLVKNKQNEKKMATAVRKSLFDDEDSYSWQWSDIIADGFDDRQNVSEIGGRHVVD